MYDERNQGNGGQAASGKKAAMYLRMSDPRQECSTEIQEKIIRAYAEKNNIEIVCTYANEGKSGVVATGRHSFQKLIADVENKEADLDFSLLLVYVMSLVENMARRQHTAMDLMKGIDLLKSQGYGVMDISRKTGLADSYVSGILTLLNKGEERLLSDVEKGHIPLSIAIKIASSPGAEQKALQEAYEKEGLRGNRFVAAQRLIEKRRNLGKGMRLSPITNISAVKPPFRNTR